MRVKREPEPLVLHDVFINNNVPRHGNLIRNGEAEVSGNYMDIWDFDVDEGLPVEGERYNIFTDIGEFKNALCSNSHEEGLVFMLR